MLHDDSPPPSSAAASPPERRFLRWGANVFAANVLCVLMLAGRAASPERLRGYFDILVFVCLVGGASFAVIRLMFVYPYRLLDLVVIVMVLSLGMKYAIDGARFFQHTEWYEKFLSGSPPNPGAAQQESEGPSAQAMAEWCIVTGCVLLAGAALGLRHCRLLNADGPLKRAAVLACGMVVIPAPVGLVAVPPFFLKRYLRDKAAAGDR